MYMVGTCDVVITAVLWCGVPRLALLWAVSKVFSKRFENWSMDYSRQAEWHMYFGL